MILVEMAFQGPGGLECLVEKAALALEGEIERLGLDWQDSYPITLRESLRLGLQQQIITGRARRGLQQDPSSPVYRVWIGLPEGGLRAWTDGLVQRVLDACGAAGLPPESDPHKRLQSALVQTLGPCLQRAEVSEALAGIS